MQPQGSTKRKVTTDSLNIRAQPTTSAAIVGQYKQGDIFEIVAAGAVQADNHNWQQTADNRGWVAVDLTAPGDDAATSGVNVISTSTTTVPNTFPPVPTAAGSGTPTGGITVLSTSTTTVPNAAAPTAVSAPAPATPTISVISTSSAPAIAPAPAQMIEWSLPFHAAMRGVGASAGGWAPEGKHLDLCKRNNIEIVLVVAYEPGQAARTIQPLRDSGVKHFILRAAIHEAIASPQRFVQITTPILKEYADAIGNNSEILIAIHNEVNLVQEGWTKSWRDGTEFAGWWRTVADSYRHSFPGAKMGFPAMSPGGDVPNIRLNENAFVQQARSAIDAADWVGVHYYWANRDGSDIKPPFAQWRQWFGSKPLIGTEVGPTDGNIVDANAVRVAYQKFEAIGVPAMAWLLNGAGAWQNAAWDMHGIYL